jgi:small subunit ribosomal protein S1
VLTQDVDVDVMERWLVEKYDYERPRRGDIRGGEILKVDERGVVVDLGLKRDGFIPRYDVERLGEEVLSSLEPGQEVKARIVRLEDAEGNLLLSMYQARFEKDWTQAQEALESGEIWRSKVVDCNRGGLLVQANNLRGFVPASHLEIPDRRHLSSDERIAKLEGYLGHELTLKVIEADRRRRRLVLSERLARKQLRQQHMERLLNELVEGQVVRGTVRGLRPFGAFIDLGGAEGLIHISELAWRRVRHPNEVLQVGDEIDAYVLRLDHERERIGLSLKRLQPNPWTLVDETYTAGQLVSGTVTNVADFGAFVALDLGVEGLVHISELADRPPSHPRESVKPGDELVLRILRIDSSRERINLSLKQISERERENWLDRPADDRTAGADQPDAPASAGQPGDDGFWMSLVENGEAEQV